MGKVSKEFGGLLRKIVERHNPSDNQTVQEMRATLKAAVGHFVPVRGTTTSSVVVNGVPGEWVKTPNSRDEFVILYLHGGGYVAGSAEIYRSLTSKIADEFNARVLAIDYRLAPEHPFPAALDDAVAAFGGLVADNYDPSQIAIVGDSAGGGLSIATLMALRNTGQQQPACAVALCPFADLTISNETYSTLSSFDPSTNFNHIKRMASCYSGDNDPRNPAISPVFGDFSDLAPLLIQAAGRDLILGHAIRIYERATAAGAVCELDLWEEMIHVWHIYHSMVPEGAEAIEKAAIFCKAHLNGSAN